MGLGDRKMGKEQSYRNIVARLGNGADGMHMEGEMEGLIDIVRL
jgi:hypothetical protein